MFIQEYMIKKIMEEVAKDLDKEIQQLNEEVRVDGLHPEPMHTLKATNLLKQSGFKIVPDMAVFYKPDSCIYYDGEIVEILEKLDDVFLIECEHGTISLFKDKDLLPLWSKQIFISDFDITISTDGRKIVVVEIEIEGLCGQGIAKCHDMDEFNLDIGFSLAIVRSQQNLLENLENEMLEELEERSNNS